MPAMRVLRFAAAARAGSVLGCSAVVPERRVPIRPTRQCRGKSLYKTQPACIPFGMRNVRLRALPPLPTVSRFLELNVRTYVTYDGYPGVYFLSLDAASRLAVAAARRWYRLPYVNAAMEMTRL